MSQAVPSPTQQIPWRSHRPPPPPKAEENPLMRLPIDARRAIVKLINVVPLLCPPASRHLSIAEIKRIERENKLTAEEHTAFRRHFPDGFFGRMVLNPSQDEPNKK